MLVFLCCAQVRAGAAPGHTDPVESFDTNVAHGGEWLEGALLIAVDPSMSDAKVKSILELVGCTVHHQFGRRPLYRANCAGKLTIREQVRRLATQPDIGWVEPFWRERLEATPNDLTLNQWHHLNEGQTIDGLQGIVGADIGSVSAWDITVGNGDPLIAIVDTGIYRGHEELQGRLYRNPDWTRSATTDLMTTIMATWTTVMVGMLGMMIRILTL